MEQNQNKLADDATAATATTAATAATTVAAKEREKRRKNETRRNECMERLLIYKDSVGNCWRRQRCQTLSSGGVTRMVVQIIIHLTK